MSIEVTPHGKRPYDQADLADVLQQQADDADGAMFVVADGQKSAPVKYKGLYRIYATSPSRVRAGAQTLANANGGARFSTDMVEVWWLEAGAVVACDAVA